MSHPDIELLTQLALDDPLALDAETLVHIDDCDECTREIEMLQRVVAATVTIRDDETLPTLLTPPDHVWEQIAAATVGSRAASDGTATATHDGVPRQGTATTEGWLFDDAAADGVGGAAEGPPPARITPAAQPPRRRTALQLVAAAVVGVVVGGLFTWVLTERDDSDDGGGTDPDLATSQLTGIDGNSTSGEATFEPNDNGGQITISLDPEDKGPGFVQAWLLDEETGGMVALGVIDGDEGTFAVPSDLDLSVFNQIDISLEPYDGDPQHSAVSLARGPVP